MGYISLHNHTASSNIRFLDSINRPKDMVKRAIELGYEGMAFTDHEALSVHVDLLKIQDSLKETNPDFKIIHGNEIYLIDESAIKNTRDFYHFILLAKDIEGWHQLCALSSRAWERGYFERGSMRVPTTYQDIEEIVGKNPGHLLASSACLGGRLPKDILNHDVQSANNFVKWCITVFGRENFALELQPSDSEEQLAVNPILVKMAKHYNLKFIVTTDSHYLNKEDFGVFSSYLNSKQSGDRETEKFYKYTYVMPIEEIREVLKLGISEEDTNQAIDNTVLFTADIKNIDFRHGTIVPERKLPEFSVRHLLKGWYEEYPFVKYYAYSVEPQDRFLMYQIENGLVAKNIDITNEVVARINTELDVVLDISKKLNQNLSAYLNLAVDMINIAWKVSLVGCGRGSACGFMINYLIGITQVNPMTYDLPYWRFANKERADLFDIDSDYQPEKTPDIIELFREAYGADNVLNCATFKTEGLKSAILSCGRGLGYNNDDMQALGALVPAKRGITYSLHDCLVGDEERGLEPVPDFEEKLRKYPGLFEAVQKIEGLPTNASIHASALYIFNNGYLAQNSLMRAPNKTKMTAFNMHDSDDMGALKMDVLRTDAQSKMAKCLELLLKDGQIEWQGSLRQTYDKYLHPDVLDYSNNIMWEKAATGEIANLFQFETQVGSVCIKKARPTNVMQLAEINSIMRLQVEDGEQPIDRYVRFRNDIQEWYKEMANEGLNQYEIKILEKYLLKSNGVSGSQETLMLLVMDPDISHFTLGEANAFRKAVAKKKPKDIQANKEKYFKYGHELHTRDEFLKYVWKYCVEPQLGYAFSLNHTLPYSVIAVQEMNLATRFNPLYWQCACLCVNSGNYADMSSEDEEENDQTIDQDEDTAKKTAPNYGKIAKAIADAQSQGVTIELPDINTAQADFIPDVKQNAILYSLRAITVVSDDLMDRIINNRPYSSWKDFCEKVQPTTIQMIGLIKAGCFDKLMGQSRKQIMIGYLQYNADNAIELKSKLTAVHLNKAIDLHMVLKDYVEQVRLFKFKKFIDCNQLDKANKRYVLTDTSSIKFATTFIIPLLSSTKSEYGVANSSTIWIKESSFKREYDKKMLPLMQYLNSEEGLKKYREIEQAQYISELKEKYCRGTMAAWEMQTMCFYHEPHELSKVSKELYNIADFNELPEYPDKDIDKSKNNLYALVGTITDTNNLKHIVSILTTTGIVNVKFFGGTYTNFNQSISEIDPQTKKKTVKDATWFKRGNKIIVYGERKENMFTAKKDYKNFGRIVGLIEKVYDNGTMDVRYTRNKK